jgi:hypothetical protein
VFAIAIAERGLRGGRRRPVLGFLHERLVANLRAGVAQVMVGLLLLGLG